MGKSYGWLGTDITYSIDVDATGNVYTNGYFSGTVDFNPGIGTFNLTSTSTDMFISKLDVNGNFVWAKATNGGCFGAGIALDVNGDIYTTGYFFNITDFDPNIGVTNLTSFGSADIFVAKYRPCSAITFNNTATTNATVNIPYTLNASALNAISYSVSPALPSGINLNTTTGIISGTPTAIVASTSYTVIATQGACTASQIYAFSVNNCVLFALSPNKNFLPDGFVNVPYVGATISVANPAAGVTYKFFKRNAINWQTGLTLNEDTGVISGTPTFSTSINVVIEAVNQTTGCGSSLTTYTLVIYGDPTTAIDNSLDNTANVYPNPSSDNFNIDFASLNLGKVAIRVYDAQGKQVLTTSTSNNTAVISLEKFAKGMYLMEIESQKGRILKRIIKE